MPTSTKKRTKKIPEDPLSSSGVSSLSGISSYNIRKVSIYKNGDPFHRGVKFVINPRIIKDMAPLLNQINDRIELSHGAKKLYTSDGRIVTSIKDLEDGKIYIAASAQFIPMRYGEVNERVWKPPSRKHSPIMSADRIKTARTRSQEPGKRGQQKSLATGDGGIFRVQRSRSVKTLTEERKTRRDGTSVNGVSRGIPHQHKKSEHGRLKIEPTKVPVTSKKPPTPKRVNKKVLGAAMGAGVTVVGAAYLGAAKNRKTIESSTPKPIQTAVSNISTASSVIPAPNIESHAAEILEFPEQEKKVDMATIHRTPTPPKVWSRTDSAKSVKSMMKPATPAADRSAKVLEAKSISQQPTPESSEYEDEDEEEVEEEEEEEEEEQGGEEEEVESIEDDEEEERSEGIEEPSEEDEEESGVETPASRRSSSPVVSSNGSIPKSPKSAKSIKSAKLAE